MGNNIFANSREVACKAADGKAIAAFPDVAFTPPQTPATPPGVPIPYPNTALAKDTAGGSKSVTISGKEVMLKNKSYFKKSSGDEAGCAPKKGIITGKITGKAYFNAWSMNVKIEGQNAVRHMDLTTHNHGSFPGNSPVWPYLDSAAFADTGHPCNETATNVLEKCSPLIQKTKKGKVRRKQSIDAMCQDDDCREARKCVMSPQSPSNCCEQKTPHHPIPVAEFSFPRQKGESRGQPRFPKYKSGKAPCLCVEGIDHDAYEDVPPYKLMEHGRLGADYAKRRNQHLGEATEYPFSKASEMAAASVKKVTGCDDKCAKSQLDSGHKSMGIEENSTLVKSKQKPNIPLTNPKMPNVIKV